MDSAHFDEKRRAMIVSQLRTNGVSEGWILAAMGSTPREAFVPAERVAAAYMDRAVPIGPGRALNPPMTTGLMLLHAAVTADDAVLLIGSGTGYVAALLAARARSLVALEEDAALAATARTKLKGHSNILLAEGALQEGAAAHGPYSLIIIDGAIAELPASITAQLADGGRILAGLSDGAVTRLAMGYAHGGQVTLRPFADCEITPLPGFARAPLFTF